MAVSFFSLAAQKAFLVNILMKEVYKNLVFSLQFSDLQFRKYFSEHICRAPCSMLHATLFIFDNSISLIFLHSISDI